MGEGGQADFSVGMVRSVARDLIPEGGAYDMQDLLLDDDGNAYQRGATTRITTTKLGTSTSIGALYEGSFTAGRRMLAVGDQNFGVVDVAGAAFVSLFAGAYPPGGGLAAQIGDVMFVALQTGASAWAIVAYGGARKTALYSAGSVTVTNGSTAVTGVGTAWLANVEAGMLLRVGNVVGVVKSVGTDTTLTLVDPWRGASAAGTGYVLWVAYVLSAPSGYSTMTVAATAGRLFVAAGRSMAFSPMVDPASGQSRWSEPFSANDHHDFPADIVGLATLRDRVFVFTKAGIFVVSNVGLDIVDAYGNAQHRVEKISGDVILRSPGGVAPWRDSLVIAAVDGVYVLDASGALELISRSITPLWQQHMVLGDKVGQVATFRDHVFVCVGVVGAGAGPHEVLVGRLDRRVQTPVGKSVPWTRLVSGETSSMQAFAVQDPYGSPKLVCGLAAGLASSGHLIDATPFFVGSALSTVTAQDSSGAGFPVRMLLETRDFRPSGLDPAYVDQVRLDYESSGGTIAVAASKGVRATAGADPTFDALTTAPAGNFSTQAPRAIAVRKTGRRIAFRFTTSGTCPGLRIRAFGFRFRERGLPR